MHRTQIYLSKLRCSWFFLQSHRFGGYFSWMQMRQRAGVRFVISTLGLEI